MSLKETVVEGIESLSDVNRLWNSAWNFLKATSENQPVTNNRQFLQDGDTLVEVESSWDADSLESISVRSWRLNQQKEARIPNLESEVFVYSPDWSDLDGNSVQRVTIENATDEWVKSTTELLENYNQDNLRHHQLNEQMLYSS